MCKQHRPGRHESTTAHRKWTKDYNRKIIFRYLNVKEKGGGYRKVCTNTGERLRLKF